MAKTIEDLKKSRLWRKQVEAYFGHDIPESILVHDRAQKAIDLMIDEGGRDYASTGGREIVINGKPVRAFEISSRGARFGALSRFPQSVGRTLVLLYSCPGDTVVDPFAGHNSRMELCWRCGRNYIGHDISHEFMRANHAIKAQLMEERRLDLFAGDFNARIILHEGDSRHMITPDETGDFTITSPPYWDLEYYGDEPAQIGTGKSYGDFLFNLELIAKENFRVLRPGAFCVWAVNDFRKGGKFYPYHEHTAQILRNAGFMQHDTCITDLGQSMHQAFAARLFDLKILAKRHEYNLIFRKPCEASCEVGDGGIADYIEKTPRNEGRLL